MSLLQPVGGILEIPCGLRGVIRCVVHGVAGTVHIGYCLYDLFSNVSLLFGKAWLSGLRYQLLGHFDLGLGKLFFRFESLEV